MKKEIVLDGNNIFDKPSLYEEINRKFMANESWQLSESLDAFDDLLYGGFGALKEKEPVRLIWQNFESNKKIFGLEFTLSFYEEKLNNPEDFDAEGIQRRIDALKKGEGQTYFDIILEIIEEHENVELVPA